MKEIKVTISPDGKIKIETKGFVGKECVEATKELEKALGSDKKQTFTGEYYMEPQHRKQLHGK